MRKLSLFLLAITGMLLSAQMVSAQSTANYSFTTTTTGSLVDMSTGTSTLVAANQDDVVSSITNIGFDFWFQGIRYTQFSVNENGTMRLGGTVVQAGTPYQSLAQASMPIISAYAADQRTHTSGKVHYRVDGTAPNRILTVEWSNTQSNFNSGGTADLTYQVRLYETSGVVEYIYGSMTLSTTGAGDVNSNDPQIGFSSSNVANTVGSVTAAQSGTPAPTYNGASATPVNNTYTAGAITVLTSAANGSRRTFSFASPAATAPSGLNFTAITSTGMTLNWTDNATNEVGYAIYRSTDGVNYTFTSQLGANSTTSPQTGLSPSTTYYWKVYAFTEGSLGTSLDGNQMTSPPLNITSNGTGGGLWSQTSTWSTGTVPTSGDNVTIKDGDVVTIDIAATAFTLTVGEGTSGTLQYEAGAARTLTVGSNVAIAAGGAFTSAATGTVTAHSLSLGGNLTNNGTLDFSTNTNTAGAGITFTGASNNTFSGTGATTDIRTLILNKGTANTNILELSPAAFTVQGGITDGASMAFLTLTNGTLKISGTFTMTARLFTTASYTIGATAGIWLNNPNFTIAGQNGSPLNGGLLQLTQGVYNIGTATGNSMTTNAGAVFIIEGGAMNVTGRLQANNAITYTQSGGTVSVATIGNTSTNASFQIGVTAGTFNMSGGTIIVVQRNTNGTAASRIDYYNVASTRNITGGTLQVGSGATTTNFDFRLYGYTPNVVLDNTTNNKTIAMNLSYNIFVVFGNLTLKSGTTITGTTATNSGEIDVIGGDLTVETGASLIANGSFIYLEDADFINNGTFNGTGTNSVLYWAGTTPQTYSGSGTATAALVTMSVDNAAGVSFTSTNNLPVNRINLFTGGITNSNKLTLGNGGTTTGVVQIGNSTTPTNAGVFDVAPNFNLGSGGQILLYLRTVNARSTGPEVNPARALTTLTLDDNDASHTLTLAGGNLAVSTSTTPTFNLTNGKVDLNGSTLTLGLNATTAALAGALTHGSSAYMYNGSFKRFINAGTGNRDFPVGVTAYKRNASINFTGAPTTGGSLTAQWISSPGGSNGLPLTEGSINIEKTTNEGYWQVSAGDGLAGGTYTGTFTATGINGVGDVTQIALLKRVDASSPWVLDGTHVTGSGSPFAPVVSRTGMVGFSDFALSSSNANLLPVGLITFSGYKNGSVNQLQWTTATETNNKGFEVQRSLDGVNYAPIGFVNTLAAGGNSTATLTYYFTDNNPGRVKQYYRLRQVDNTNNSKMSSTVMIKGDRSALLAIDGLFPNPARTNLNIMVNTPKGGKLTMQVFDMSGRAVMQKILSVETGSNTLPVDISPLTSGTYMLKLVSMDGNSETAVSRFVKQ